MVKGFAKGWVIHNPVPTSVPFSCIIKSIPEDDVQLTQLYPT